LPGNARGHASSTKFQLNVGKGLSDTNFKIERQRHHSDFDNEVTKMANLEIKESKKNKESHLNHNISVKSGIMNGSEIIDTL